MQVDPVNLGLYIPKVSNKVIEFTLTACTIASPNSESPECYTSSPISLTVVALNASEYVRGMVAPLVQEVVVDLVFEKVLNCANVTR